MNTGKAILIAIVSLFVYFTLWIFGRPFFGEAELLHLLFPPFKYLIPGTLLVALWVFVGFCLISINTPVESLSKKTR